MPFTPAAKGQKPGTAPDVKAMVAAHSKVPDDQKPAYRKKVIAKARGTASMQHIPDAWLSGKPGAPADVKCAV